MSGINNSPKVIAVDCDGTIFKWGKYPCIGEPVPYALETLRDFNALGHQIVLSTVRCGPALLPPVLALTGVDIVLYGVNKRPGQEGWSLSSKIDADLFIDDKAFGCPLIVSEEEPRPYVDWKPIREVFGLYICNYCEKAIPYGTEVGEAIHWAAISPACPECAAKFPNNVPAITYSK